MNKFVRGIEPKEAMQTGAKRCSDCHKVLIEEAETNEGICLPCFEKKYGIEGPKGLKRIWYRLTNFARIMILLIIMALCALLRYL